MLSRVKKLQRLAALYKVVEHAHGISLDQARLTLHEVEATIAARRQDATRLQDASHAALSQGDLREWQLEQSQLEFAEWNAGGFEELRQSREVTMRNAAEAYQASRMQLEQMQSVLDEVRSHLSQEQSHAEQRTSDDRYLARQRWQERVAERRAADQKRKSAPGSSTEDQKRESSE